MTQPGSTADAALDARFVELYRARSDAEELAAIAPALAERLLHAHARLARHRPHGRARVELALVDADGREIEPGSPARATRLQIVTEDRPWLVASLRALLARRGRTVLHLLHPILPLERDSDGRLTGVASAGARAESCMHVDLDPLAPARLTALEAAVHAMLETLNDVRTDTKALRARLDAMVERVEHPEQAAFLRWLDERQFIAFGAARVPLDADGHPMALEQPLGILSDADGRGAWAREDFLPGRIDERLLDADQAVIVCKAGRAAPLIRDEQADLVIVVERDAAGHLLAIDCLLGLFVPGLQNEAVNAIPWMRERVSRVVDASGLDADSHDGKALAATLRGLPREMLLQTRSAQLLEMARGIARLRARRRTRVFSSADPLGRYWNCLVYLPNDVYTRELRLLIERHIERGIDGFSTSFESQFASSSPLARIHFVVRTRGRRSEAPDWPAIEADIVLATESFGERIGAALLDILDTLDTDDNVARAKAVRIVDDWGSAFPLAYRERYGAAAAARDAAFVSTRLAPMSQSPDAANAPFMGPIEPLAGAADDDPLFSFRLHAPRSPVSLSRTIPLIENLGFRVESDSPFELTPRDAPPVHTLVFTVRPNDPVPRSLDTLSERLQATFEAVWSGRIENDGFNRLVFAAGLTVRQANVLRSLGKYLVQARAPFSIGYVIDALVAQAPIAALLVETFEQRFDPARPADTRAAAEPIATIGRLLDQVHSLDEDRILRRLLGTLLAILRTNHFQRDADGRAHDYLSFKFDCAEVPDLPLPRPRYEIFVSSARVDGVHLRGGAVARGGLRWSDRREDYRTEVLGLMKAQMVKNAVIVPVGSKGGFYVKTDLPSERSAAQAVVVDCYRTFLKGLLDITDDIVADAAAVSAIRPPADVVRRDGDDPYLVVAADKGTATFSDHANALALDYGFWLGDAFASGGSAGYDHKKMGITARGAWESVKRHFRGLGTDVQTTPFTVVGIGDMGGDVFGNGMLLSKEIRLVAAFNHLHVFIDPAPATEVAWTERKRLFELPRSSWDDYDRALISAGGGVFSRGAKRIELSSEAATTLGLDPDNASLTPDELISAILAAPVDLLWNGGIGTYVKASAESHADAADRANDSLRIDANALRARVVGEGGNLGLTQRARLEYALGGGLIYTDAIDNAAGVDCSDHEVNIKILLNAAIGSGALDPLARDALLASMTNEVAALVLRDNYLQTECIDLTHAEGLAAFDDQSRFMDALESAGRLARDIEYLPDHDTLAAREAAGQPLTRPEIAVLTSYAKMSLYDALLASDLPDRAAHRGLLTDYFPSELGRRFDDEMAHHRLAREIVATVATNETVNRLGPTFVDRIGREFGVSPAVIVEAFLAVRDVFRLGERWAALESLDNRVEPAALLRMRQLVRGLAERGAHWILRTLQERRPEPEEIARWRKGVDELVGALPSCLSSGPAATLAQRIAFFTAGGAPDDIAAAVAGVVPLSSALDLVEIAHSSGEPVTSIAALYFELGEFLDLHWLRDAIAALPAGSAFHDRARSELRSDLHYQHRHLAAEVALVDGPQQSAASTRLERWASGNRERVERYRALLGAIHGAGAAGDAGGDAPDFVTLSLAVKELHKLLRTRRPLGG